ncbi:MAG: hypothetical protein M9962_01710 [Oligoflexia bacterium]|nr:hypothetical protein [Oligoflexia bacterium]
MKGILSLFLLLSLSSSAFAAYTSQDYLREGMKFERRAQYFQAARYYFQALQRAETPGNRGMAYAYISNALIGQKMYQSAAYFFLKAISDGDDGTIRMALRGTRQLVDNVGGVLFKKYALKYTKEDQYPREGRDYFLYFIAQDHLHQQRPHDVIRAVTDMNSTFVKYPAALFLRGTAYLMVGAVESGINDFKACANNAESGSYRGSQTKQEAYELKNRCLAGIARGYYQGKNYNEAENWYERVEIKSFVWPQIQYERAWNSIARGDYNRALGRLVSYKAPGLSWFHDSEIEMLRAISYLQMCLYDDVEKESDAFMKKYGAVGQQMKAMLDEAAGGSLRGLVRLFQRGVEAMNRSVYSENPMHQVMSRFVRSPYFVDLAQSGNKIRKELEYLSSLGNAGRRGLGGFLREVLNWRWQTSQELGGIFIRDRLATEYKSLIANVSTIDIVKLEMLRRARSQVERLAVNVNVGEDVWGNKKRGSLGKPYTRNDQYFWQFNGEFWADELGDYVFALRPECY